jgi:hypothetical protein
MNRLMLQAALSVVLCPLLTAQQPTQAASTSSPSQAPSEAQSMADVLQPSAANQRILAVKNARTISVNSDTVFLTVSTLDRALMNQKGWGQLGLNIVDVPHGGDLEIQVDRLVFTHIHTYILTDKATGIVLASGRVRAFDGVVASGPMAEQIVNALCAARLSARPSDSGRGL